ncbi:hypothetical protein CERZMDRAFT_91663 [Cercospora zeae-maydis SCOH1-5]|uniref:Uncharacterized protein n=1 Tax=Cercospora zeae-maydis SCOH1-5 TaxID=717836 RepID=A0A6A6F5L7_9PEZI|nr:hypothetical protein CERZMDRAFT_91663 [Cercospora zeae-maydis SCOH1-5]
MPAVANAPPCESHSDDARDPFATPPIDAAANTPAPPPPVAFAAPKTATTEHCHPRPRPPLSPASSHHGSLAFPTKSASMSSSNTSPATPFSSIDLEKGVLGREIERTPNQRQSSRDPEKAAAHSPTRHSRDRHAPPYSTRIAYVEEGDANDTKAFQETKAVNILLFLAAPCALLSALIAVWTIISLFITVMTQPVRLCARRPTFGQQLGGLVGPALNLQLRSIHTPLPPHADEDTSYRPGMLVLVSLLSPFLSMGMALAAWVAAIFWLSSAVVGDPAGMDKRDDGRETVMALRKWWEKWLIGSMRDE